MERARAAVLVGPERMEVEEFPVPEVAHDDGVLWVEACGVCGSDVAPFRSGADAPLVLGHEVVGRIGRIGATAAHRWGVNEGDRVVIERAIPCGRCSRCRDGDYRVCNRDQEPDGRRRYGSTRTDVAPSLWGGYADAVYLHPDALVHRAPEDVQVDLLPLFMPIGNAISWFQGEAQGRVGSTAVIQGPGHVGLAAVVAARAAGFAQVILTGLEQDAHRLEAGRALGADHALVADPEHPKALLDEVAELTGERGADIVVDVTTGPSNQPVEMALELAAENGTVILTAPHDLRPSTDFAAHRIWSKRLTVRGVRGRDRASVDAALDLIARGTFPLEEISSYRTDLEHADLAIRGVAGETEAPVTHAAVIPGGLS